MDNLIFWAKAKKYIGQNLTDGYNELGCAAAVNNVVRYTIGQPINDSPSTIKMYESLLKDKRFKQVIEPGNGVIIISPTNGLYIGHTGIISNFISGKNFKIMSNNSKTYLWDEHLTLDEWWLKFKNLPTYLFRLVENDKIEVEVEQKKISILKQIVAIYQQIISLLKK